MVSVRNRLARIADASGHQNTEMELRKGYNRNGCRIRQLPQSPPGLFCNKDGCIQDAASGQILCRWASQLVDGGFDYVKVALKLRV